MNFKYIIIFIALFSSNLVFSETYYENARLQVMPGELQDKVADAFNEIHFKRAFVPKSGSSLLGLNMLFTDPFFQAQVGLKFNVTGQFELNEVYVEGGLKIIHFKLNKTPTAIMFKGISSKYIIGVLDKLKKIEVSYLNINPISKAYAQTCAKPEVLENIDIDSRVAENSAASMITGCLKDAGSGAEEATWGTVKNIGNGVSKEWGRFWKSPRKRLGEYWGFVENGLGKLWEFTKVVGQMLVKPTYAVKVLKQKFGEIGNFFVDVYSNISAMPFESKVSMICNIVGSIGVDALLAAVTVGAAGGKLGITIARVLGKIKKIAGMLGKGLNYSFKVLNELSDEVLRKMNKIIDSGNKKILNRKIKELGCAF